ncbi:hypothetical protein PSP6_690026 [Paraburkholderia tropica]|nr:hypothetical protein PSP6_690026 [Paraburkholderia tropica]
MTVAVPAADGAVNVMLVWPLEFVEVDVADSVPSVVDQVTVAPLTRLPFAS